MISVFHLSFRSQDSWQGIWRPVVYLGQIQVAQVISIRSRGHISNLIVSITKLSIMIGSLRAFLSRFQRTITWVSTYRCPIIGLYTYTRIFFEIFRSFRNIQKILTILRYLENFGIFRKRCSFFGGFSAFPLYFLDRISVLSFSARNNPVKRFPAWHFASTLFWKLLYFHITGADNLWHTFQLPRGEILA